VAKKKGNSFTVIGMKIGIKVPEKKLPILLKERDEIENLTHTKIEIGNEVIIDGETLDIMIAENIIKAIARGFKPEDAFMLLDETVTLCIIPLTGSEKKMKRIKARIIGSNGSAKKRLEEMTNTIISVYGKTISIIGSPNNVFLCRMAIEKFITGSSHRYVYKFLENMIRKKLFSW
jgi:ribosomal RNA assembly protein